MLLVLLKVQLWHIQANGQSLNWKVTNVLNKINFGGSVVIHKIFQKYQNSNRVTFLTTSSNFKTVIEVKDFHDVPI